MTTHSKLLTKKILKLKGPIVIIGAGGFVGYNLLSQIAAIRKDVIGIVRKSKGHWRYSMVKDLQSHLQVFDITNEKDIEKLVTSIKPQTIFNLSAYGAYSRQKDIATIHRTNYLSTIFLLEALKRTGFCAYIHTGSQSEYGLNAAGPKESDELIPNSHYAISKVGNFYTIKYYGKVEKLPVTHVRLYSVYGPWEEPDRLIPIVISHAIKGTYPQLVDPDISRDFIHVDDVVEALVTLAIKMNNSLYGEVFNIATGKKTTIRQLVSHMRKIFKIKSLPKFGTMEQRKWDVQDWYGNNKKITNTLAWKPRYTLKKGLRLTTQWQKNISYDPVKWGWKPRK